MTGASSRITCQKCLGQSRADDLERWYEALGKPSAVWHSIRDAVDKAKAATTISVLQFDGSSRSTT
jgi:hypothetical protein